MKTVLANLILFWMSPIAFGQVSGQLTTIAGHPIPFASVLLLRSVDSLLVKATLTNDAGFYRFDTTASGMYRLRAGSLGYQPWHSPVFELTATQRAKDFGTQVMKDDTKQLGEVIVRAAKPLYQPITEGTVINIESSVLSKGSSALQILERSPGVVIDYRNSSIGLNGKNGVVVLLNGKPMRMPVEQVVALLNGMTANDIEKIELLTTPGARYDAEGSAGMINIVLKKTTKPGTNGSISLTGGYGVGEKGTSSINLVHNTRTVGLYGSYSFLHDRTYSDLFIHSTQNMPVLGGKLDVLVYDTIRAVQNNHDVTAGFDLKLNPKSTVGGSISWNRSVRSATDFNQTGYTILPDSLLLFRGTISGKSRWQNLISSVYGERKFREGEQLNSAIDYLHFTNTSPSEVRSTFLTRAGTQAGNNDSLFAPQQRGFANTTIQVGVAKLDYTRQLAPRTKLEAGLKGTYTRNLSGAGIESLVDDAWVSRSETATRIVMRERIGAAYASVTSQVNQSTNLVVGARYEYSRTKLDNSETEENLVDRKLGVLFPSIFFTRKLTEHTELQLSYTKRISRPSFTDLASFVRYSDPSAVYAGNPLLRPTITNNLKLGYTYRGYSLSLLFSRDNHPIARYQLTEGPARNLLYVSPQNLAWQNNITLQVSVPLKINNWWDMSYGFTGGIRQFKAEYTPQPVQKTYFGYSVNVNQSIKLPRSFSTELSGWYNSVSYNGTINVGGMGALSAGIKKELKNNGGSFQLSVTDLLRTMRINTYYGTITEEAFSIKNHVSINTESSLFPIMKLTYTRSFGRTHITRQSRRESGSQDERNRVDKN
ncbi:TonB-dependent receptor domain-containing protein [Spirosoma arcticum]